MVNYIKSVRLNVSIWKANCIYIKDLPAEWCKGLLLLVVRDALEGDLILGWGKGRGYGNFNLRIRLGKILVSSWANLKAYLRSRYNIQLGLAALHEQITL